MTFIPLETEIFSYQHLLDSDENLKLIKSFSVKEESGKGLENYLKNVSEIDERNDLARTYFVRLSAKIKSYQVVFLFWQINY